MKAIILAAGSGSRLAPIGLTTPKILVPILNRPLIHFHIEAIKDIVQEAIIVIGSNQHGQQIQDYIDQNAWPIPLSTVIQPEPLGTANSFQAAEPLFEGKEQAILGLNGDDLYSPSDLTALAQHPYAALGNPVDEPEIWGIFRVNQDNHLIEMVEKPTRFIGNLANTGAWVATTEIFSLYHQIKPSLRGEYEVTDSLSLLAQRKTVKVAEVRDYWLPIGYPWHILQANQALSNHQQLSQPLIGQNVAIGKNTNLLGTVVIGDNVIIGDDVTIENSTIFEGTSIDDQADISHSVIDKNVSIGPQVICLSQQNHKPIISMIKGQPVDTGLTKFGATIGDNATINDGVTIYPGIKIWPNHKIESNRSIKTDIAA